MSNQELINALSKRDPNGTVTICINQYNKIYGKHVDTSKSTSNISGYEESISGTDGHTIISISLPEKATIRNWPENY